MAKRVYFHFDFRANVVKKHSLTEEFKSAGHYGYAGGVDASHRSHPQLALSR